MKMIPHTMDSYRSYGCVQWTFRSKRPVDIEPGLYETVAEYEGLAFPPGRVYTDSNGNATIGRGHLLIPNDVHLLYQLFGTHVRYERVRSGAQTLSMDQVETLFDHDIEIRVRRLRDVLPRWSSYLPTTRLALLQACFRGDLGPKTLDHVRSGRFFDASKEILRTSDSNDPRIRPRLLDASRGLLREFVEGTTDPKTIERRACRPFSIEFGRRFHSRGVHWPRGSRSCRRAYGMFAFKRSFAKRHVGNFSNVLYTLIL